MEIIEEHRDRQPFPRFGLSRRLAALRELWDACYFGITGDYEQRAWDHSLTYSLMVVLHEDDSASEIRDLEAWVIDENWQWCDNRTSGGGGHLGNPPYFLYVVLR